MKEKPLKRATRILIFIGAFLSSVCARALPCPSQSDPLGRYTVESAGTGDLGSIWTEGASSGSRIRISVRCDQGFIAQPSVITRCSNGTWSKLWPQCVSRNISGGFLRISPQNISLYVGDHHMFQCSPSYTAWSVYWEKNGQRLDNSNTNYQVGSNLQLRDLQEENEGKYTCFVHDRRGRIMIRADAWLYVIPRINISTVCGTVLFWKENKNLSSLAQEENADTETEENDDGSIDWSSSSVINEAKRNSGYIVGGYITKHGSAPFMVGMWKRTQLNSWDFHCGATLVDQMWVMTAAHCLFDKSKNALHKEDLKLIFGDFDTRTTNDSEKTGRPSEIIMHEDFESSTLDNDIALIRFEPPLREFTPYIRPVCLAPVGLSRYLTESGTSGRATGWGRLSYHGVTSRFLKAVELPVVNRQTCRESVRNGRLTDNMFCAGHHEGGQDSCRGDSGGPFAVRYEDGRWYQVGIVSWGKGCAEEGRYGFYTHVSRFLKWIRSKNVTIAFSRKVAGQFNEKNDCNAFVYRVRSDNHLDLLEESKVNLTCVPSLDDESVQWYIGNDNEEDRRQNPLEDCNLDAIFTDTNVTWFKDGRRISSGATDGIIVDQHNSLLIPNLDSRYEGHYACVIRSEENEYFRSETNIRIYRQLTVPPSTAAVLGDDVSLVCTSSETNPIFIWTYVTTGLPLYFGTHRATALGVHDNVVLEEATDAQTSVLMINNIELEDEGDYRCSIHTQTTFSSVTVVSVEVSSVPNEIDLISTDSFANYQATCDAIGSKPEESITWILDGVVQSDGIVETDPGVSARPLFDKRSVFTFPASLDNYNVTLVCEIGGHQVSSLNRRETRRVDIQGRFAFFRIAPSDACDIEIGGHHMFLCSPIDDTWSVSWEKDDQPLEEALIVQGNLILSDIQEEDEGKYTCVVRNRNGRTKAKVDAWLLLSVPTQIDISDVCGTITFWGQYRLTPLQIPDELSLSSMSSDISWSSNPSGISSSFNSGSAASGRVVGGNEAKRGSAPYMVRILAVFDGEWRTRCAGTLLDQRWIMTTASCMFNGTGNLITKEDIRLLLGDHDVVEQEDSEIEVRPAEIIAHEGYNNATHDNNIALIRIQPPLGEFTPYIRPICLPTDSLSSRLIHQIVLGRVTGWGREEMYSGYSEEMYWERMSRVLTEVELPTVARRICQYSLRDDYELATDFTDNMFCAGYYDTPRDACVGDGGAPFAVRHDGRWYQLGIVSWGIGCARTGEYGFYTHVSRFLQWIRSKKTTVAYSPKVAHRFRDSQCSMNVLAFKVKSPNQITVTEGSKINLKCVPNRVDASVKWFIGNHPDPVFLLEEGAWISPSGKVFHFDAIKEEYAGAYSCEATVDNEKGVQVIRADFHLEVTPA